MLGRVLRSGAWLIAASLLLGGCMDLLTHPVNHASPTDPKAACLPGIQVAGNVVGYGCPTRP